MKESVENYLETIFVLTERNGKVRSIDIVNEMKFTKPSISIAVKKLRENGFVKVDCNGYITLTEEGNFKAEKIFERHNVLTQILIYIGVSEETAKKDACRIEHVISDETFDIIKKISAARCCP